MAVPDTITFSFSDVAIEIYGSSFGGLSLSAAFGNATASEFDPRYEGNKNELLNFRNYGGVNTPGPYLGSVWGYNSYTSKTVVINQTLDDTVLFFSVSPTFFNDQIVSATLTDSTGSTWTRQQNIGYQNGMVYFFLMVTPANKTRTLTVNPVTSGGTTTTNVVSGAFSIKNGTLDRSPGGGFQINASQGYTSVDPPDISSTLPYVPQSVYSLVLNFGLSTSDYIASYNVPQGEKIQVVKVNPYTQGASAGWNLNIGLTPIMQLPVLTRQQRRNKSYNNPSNNLNMYMQLIQINP